MIGNGVAGVTAASHLRRLDPSCTIDLVAESAHPFYNKVAITRLISERSGMSNMALMPDGWYDENRVVQWLNTRATSVDLSGQEVRLGTGEALPYDRLVLATGSSPRRPLIPGAELPGVFTLGSADDAMNVRAFLQGRDVRRAVVIGGGLIGVEAADAFAKLGVDCTIVEQTGWLCSRDIDAPAGRLLALELADRGIEIEVHGKVTAIEGSAGAERVTLADGRGLDADIVILCAGIVAERRPRTRQRTPGRLGRDRRRRDARERPIRLRLWRRRGTRGCRGGPLAVRRSPGGGRRGQRARRRPSVRCRHRFRPGPRSRASI